MQFYVFQGSKKEREGISVKAWANIKKKVRKPHDAVFTLRIYKTSWLLTKYKVYPEILLRMTDFNIVNMRQKRSDFKRRRARPH